MPVTLFGKISTSKDAQSRMIDGTLSQISEHVYWMAPAKPDRPSLCAVVGTNDTLMLDGGASDAHARQFLQGLTTHGILSPTYLAMTHWHWDHVFGAAEIGAHIVAQRLTAQKLRELATRDWSDAGLEQHIALGEQTVAGAEDVKAELPAPRTVRIAQPGVIFNDSMELRLGAVTCNIQHVGGDHAADSSVMLILPDRVLFLGDCLYASVYGPKRCYTAQRLLSVIDKLEALDATYYVGGHDSTVATRKEFTKLTDKMRRAVTLVEAFGADEERIFRAVAAEARGPLDQDAAYFLRALIAGLPESKTEGLRFEVRR